MSDGDDLADDDAPDVLLGLDDVADAVVEVTMTPVPAWPFTLSDLFLCSRQCDDKRMKLFEVMPCGRADDGCVVPQVWSEVRCRPCR